MLQSIPAVPSTPLPPPPLGYCRAFARLVSPRGGAFANFVLPGGQAFANPRVIPKLLTRTQFPIKIKLYRGFYWKNKHTGSSVKDRKQLKRVLKPCSQFYACISLLLIKPEHNIAKSGAINVIQHFLVKLNQISVDII